MKSSLRKFWVLLALAAVSTMILLSIMALSQESEPSEKRLHRQRVAASKALAEQEEVAPPWAYQLASAYQKLTFPACAFVPYQDGYDYFGGIVLYLDSGVNGVFYAPIILPDYTQIKRIILIAWDNGDSDVTLKLKRMTNIGGLTSKVIVASTGTATVYRRFVSSYISYTVRNSHYSQFLQVSFSGTGTRYVFLMAKILYKNCYWPT